MRIKFFKDGEQLKYLTEFSMKIEEKGQISAKYTALKTLDGKILPNEDGTFQSETVDTTVQFTKTDGDGYCCFYLGGNTNPFL
jgi:hypothetical protein